MKVVISCCPRLWADKLAAQCERHGALAALVTSFPKFALDRSVPRNKIRSLIFHQVASQISRRLFNSIDISEALKRKYDEAAARYLKQAMGDLFVGWSGYSLSSLKTAKSLGMICVIERGSTHIHTHRKLLQEEYERMGEPFEAFAWDKVAEREMQEFALTDALFVPSSFVQRSFVENGFPEKKIIRVPYGVETEKFAPKPYHGRDHFKVVSLGMITLRKGQHYLLEAMKNFINENKRKKIELHLVGPINSDARKVLERYRDVITFAGRKSHSEVAALLGETDAMVLPSIEEGFARAILEAMACGVPTIITPNTGGTDIISDGKNGFVVPIRDSKAIKEKLQLLLDNPELATQIGRAANVTVSQSFTWNHYGDKTIAGYYSLMEALA